MREEESFLYVFVPANIKVIFLQEHNLPKHRDEAGGGADVGNGEQHRVAEVQRVRELCREEGKAGHRQWVDGLLSKEELPYLLFSAIIILMILTNTALEARIPLQT